MPAAGQPGQALVQVVDRERDVPAAGAEVVRAPVMVERQLEHGLVVAEREEVVVASTSPFRTMSMSRSKLKPSAS